MFLIFSRLLPNDVVERTHDIIYGKGCEGWQKGHLYGHMNRLRNEDPNFIKGFDSSFDFSKIYNVQKNLSTNDVIASKV